MYKFGSDVANRRAALESTGDADRFIISVYFKGFPTVFIRPWFFVEAERLRVSDVNSPLSRFSLNNVASSPCSVFRKIWSKFDEKSLIIRSVVGSSKRFTWV